MQANQTVQVAEALRLTAGLLPAIGCFLVFLIYRFVYNMTDEKMAEVQQVVNSLSEHLESEIEETTNTSEETTK